MLDIKFIRENLDLVKKSTKEKGYKIDVDMSRKEGGLFAYGMNAVTKGQLKLKLS